MKKRFLAALATGLLVVGMGGVAQALTIQGGTIDIGNYDTFGDSGVLGDSSMESEVAFIDTVFGTSFTKTDYYKYDFVSDQDKLDSWFAVDGSNGDGWAYDLKFDGGYFLIKTGNFKIVDSQGKNVNGLTVPDTFAYSNVPSNDWAAITFSGIKQEVLTYFAANSGYTVVSFDVTKFSHVGEIKGAPVPEPATMLLFGTGLAGLAGIARRRKKN